MSEKKENDSSVMGAPKKVDIFQHLKLCMKNNDINCKCPNPGEVYYCVPCKVLVCKNCGFVDHERHLLIKKSDYLFTKEKINGMFDPIEQFLNKEPLFIDCDSTKQRLISNIERITSLLHQKIDLFKDLKIKEINSMFDSFQKNSQNLKTKIANAKAAMLKYLDKNKNFYNLNNMSQNLNSDLGNTVFLINYDLLNIAYFKSATIEANAKTLDKELTSYQENQLEEGNNIVDQIDKILFSKTKDIKKGLNPNLEDPDLPTYKFIQCCNTFNEDLFSDINERIAKYNSQIETFKKNVFNAVAKSGNLRDIEKLICNLECTKQKGADNLFSKRKVTTSNGKEVNVQSALAYNVNKMEDISLNNPILQKYFAYLTIDLYGEYFKMETKELQSSHADLMIKVDEEEETDFGKAVENSNEIMIYDKKNSKIIKKKLNLTRNPYGYTKFPFGCRYLLLGDKLYITGGKDETKEYAVVLIYDRKTDKVKRIMDLNCPRSYHTMIFNEVFETIMIIGGENENSVEIFDPLTNRWQLLPELNYPRANSYFYFDESRGFMYSLFGVEGKIMNNLYSDVVEYLDLTNIKNGWVKMDYNLKESVNLKCYLNVYPLNNELILIYGGVVGRGTTKTVCVLNLTKKQVGKVDRQLMDELRVKAKKSRRLSTIISTISNANIANN